MPGVIISFLKTIFKIPTSFGLHTIASKLAFFAKIDCFKTTLFRLLLNPISLRDSLLREVRVVTPISLVLPATFFAAFNAS